MSSDEPQADEIVTLIVDQETCIGSGTCEFLEEQTFELDDDTNIADTIGDGLLPRDRALIVIDRCPAAAISIADTSKVDPGP